MTRLAGCGSSPADPGPQPEPPPVPQFAEASRRLGLEFAYDHGGAGRYHYTEVIGGGGALFDYDGDDLLDIYLPQGSPLPGCRRTGLRNRLFRNEGARGFRDVTAAAGVDGYRGGRKLYGIGCAVADYDNDGFADLLVTGFGGCILYRNRGNGTFSDVTRSAGIRAAGFHTSAAFFDYDRDGWLDLFLCGYVDYRLGDDFRCANPRQQLDYCQPGLFPPGRSLLFRNLGNGRFADVTRSAGITSAHNKALGVVAGDLNGDGLPDLYVTCDLTPNLLYLNRGDGTFREEATPRGCALSEDGQPQAGMGVDARDVDGDERPDLLVTNYWGEKNNLYRNLGEGIFADAASLAGLGEPSLPRVGFGAGLRDFDNDGWLDLFVTNGHVLAHPGETTPGTAREQCDQLFLNTGRGLFREISQAAGEWFRRPHIGRGAAFGDVNNDGSLDVLVTSNVGQAALLLNRPAAGGWLSLRLQGRQSNRDGIGARVGVTAGGRTRWDEVRSAYSYCSASDVRVHFGLGSAAAAERVEVVWPSGRVDRFHQVAGGRFYQLTEGGSLVRKH